jgi:hypothetical protein
VHFNVRQFGGDGFFFSSLSFLSPAVGTCSWPFKNQLFFSLYLF